MVVAIFDIYHHTNTNRNIVFIAISNITIIISRSTFFINHHLHSHYHHHHQNTIATIHVSGKRQKKKNDDRTCFPLRCFVHSPLSMNLSQENYILLLTELREVLTKEGLLLTTAVSLQKPIIDKAYDIPALSGVTDLLLLRGYNFHGTFNTYTHHHAPLYAHPEDAGINLFLNIVSVSGCAFPACFVGL